VCGRCIPLPRVGRPLVGVRHIHGGRKLNVDVHVLKGVVREGTVKIVSQLESTVRRVAQYLEEQTAKGVLEGLQGESVLLLEQVHRTFLDVHAEVRFRKDVLKKGQET
jgi:hypothetical protein